MNPEPEIENMQVQQPTDMNRKTLRAFAKKIRRTPVPRETNNIGQCPGCDKDVFISEGQLLKYYKGQPTHKACRKLLA